MCCPAYCSFTSDYLELTSDPGQQVVWPVEVYILWLPGPDVWRPGMGLLVWLSLPQVRTVELYDWDMFPWASPNTSFQALNISTHTFIWADCSLHGSEPGESAAAESPFCQPIVFALTSTRFLLVTEKTFPKTHGSSSIRVGLRLIVTKQLGGLSIV